MRKTELMYDFGDGNGPVPAARHCNGGGWVASTARVAPTAYVNLSAQVYGRAIVINRSAIAMRARVSGSAEVRDIAYVTASAHVRGNVKVYGRAVVSDSAELLGNAEVYGRAVVCDRAVVYGFAKVCGAAELLGNAKVYGRAKVSDSAVVRGNAKVYGRAVVRGGAVIDGDTDIACGYFAAGVNTDTTSGDDDASRQAPAAAPEPLWSTSVCSHTTPHADIPQPVVDAAEARCVFGARSAAREWPEGKRLATQLRDSDGGVVCVAYFVDDEGGAASG